MPFFSGRSTTDALLLLFALTICFVIVGTTITIGVVEIRDPATDTTKAGAAVGGVINTLLGLLAGFLAGRTEVRRRRVLPQDEEEP
jgi:hypothetical protein